MNILVIEPDLTIQDEIQQLILEIDLDHDVSTAYSSFEASQKFQKRRFDLILAEIYLEGGIQGDELMQDVPYRCFKVGMATMLESPKVRQPFNDFILKPVTPDKLKKTFKMAEYNRKFQH